MAHEHPATSATSLLLDRALLGHVDTVQEFTDILVPYTAETLDGGGWTRRSQHVGQVDGVAYTPDCDTF